MNMVLFWLVVMVILIVAEAATVGLVSIWFAGGALAALVSASLGAKPWLQLVLFLAVSAGLLLALRPIAKKLTRGREYATNVDANIGRLAIVVEPIDNLRGTGRVMIGSVDWTARSEDGSVIEGLYATGDCTGGFFAQTYPNLFTGLACGRTMTFGRRAAKIVAKK